MKRFVFFVYLISLLKRLKFDMTLLPDGLAGK